MSLRGHSFLAIALGCALACDGRSVSAPTRETSIDFAITSGSGLVARATSSTEIDLSWPAAPRVTGYQVFRSSTGSGSSYNVLASTMALTFADTGLSSATQYCYELRSYTSRNNSTNYSSFSSPACASTPLPPINPPSAIAARPLGSRLVRVSWKDNSPNEDGFRVERNLNNYGWTQLVSAGANSTSVTDSVPAELNVCYRVSAFGAAGVSPTSAADCTAAPAAPSMLESSSDLQAITVNWMDLSTVEDGYAVFRLNSSGVWMQLASLAANATRYRDAAVMPGVTYRYLVRAMKDSGYSDASASVERTIPTVLPPPPVLYAGYGPAESWRGLPYALAVSWTDTSAVLVDGHGLQQTSDTTAWGPSVSGGGTSPYISYSLNSVAEYFRITAFNAMGESQPSNVACAEWAVAPTNVTATGVDQHTIHLTWTDNTQCEYGFLILRAVGTDTVFSIVDEAPRNATSYDDSSLDPGTTWSYILIVDVPNFFDEGYGPTAMSGAASATTLADATLSARVIAPVRIARPKVGMLRLTPQSMQRLRLIHTRYARRAHSPRGCSSPREDVCR